MQVAALDATKGRLDYRDYLRVKNDNISASICNLKTEPLFRTNMAPRDIISA